jgi:hypothetical protein
MKKSLLFLSVLAAFSSSNAAVTVGSIAFLGFNQDEAEHFAFVVTTDIGGGEVINFTDAGYGSNGVGESDKFRWTEHLNIAGTPGPLTWTTTSTILAGTVVIYDDTDNRFEFANGTAAGSVAGAEMDFAATGDGITAYQGNIVDLGSASNYRGDASGITFIGVTQIGGSFLTSGAGSTGLNYLPSALTNGTSAFDYTSTLDNYRYNGSRNFADWNAAFASLNDFNNWTGSDTVVASTSDFGIDFTGVP